MRSFFALAALALLALPAQAQRSSALSFGVQVGDPLALTLRLPARAPVSWTGAVAFDDGGVYVAIHRQHEYPLQGSPLHYYLAPGGFLGSADDDDLTLGASLNAGINFYIERFEIFLHVTPALRVLPETDLGLGAALGVRYAL